MEMEQIFNKIITQALRTFFAIRVKYSVQQKFIFSPLSMPGALQPGQVSLNRVLYEKYPRHQARQHW